MRCDTIYLIKRLTHKKPRTDLIHQNVGVVFYAYFLSVVEFTEQIRCARESADNAPVHSPNAPPPVADIAVAPARYARHS